MSDEDISVSDSPLKDFRRGLGDWLGWFGVAVGTMSVVSAFGRIFEVGFRSVFAELVGFYRDLLSPIHKLVNLPDWPFEVPPIAIELFALYVVLFGMAHCYNSPERVTEFTPSPPRVYIRRRKYSLRRFVDELLLLVIIKGYPVSNLYRGLRMRKVQRTEPHWEIEDALNKRIYISLGLQFLAVPVAAITFFALNEYAP